MDIDKRNRSELKAFFVKNAIPTEGNFADLIDAGLNQKEDGIVKPAGDPLSIEATGSQKKVINFYEGFADPQPAWVLSLETPDGPGFSIGDADGDSKLFIDKATGNVGIGTTQPHDKLTVVDGDARITGGNHRRLKIISDSASAGIELVARSQGEAGSPYIDFTHGDLGAPNFGLRIHAPSNELLEIQGGPLRAREGLRVDLNRSSHLDVDGAIYRFFNQVYITVDDNLYIRDSGGSAHFRFETNSGRLTVGSIRQEGWKGVSFANGWVNYSTSFNTCAYFKDSMGIVHLRGLVKNGTIGARIFTLPAGYRPQRRELHVVQSFNAVGRADVYTNGEVRATSGKNGWFSLDGITFRAI